MRDLISIERVKLLHPSIRQTVINCIDLCESDLPTTAKIRIVQGLRTIDEQNKLYAQGRTNAGKIVTNARGGRSYHNYGLAVDFALLYDKDGNGTYECLSWDTKYDFDKDGKADWLEVVSIFKAAGFAWGGDFTSFQDDPHLEKTFGYTVKQLFDKYNNKEFIKGTNYIML